MPDVTIYTLAKELNMTPSMVSRAFSPSARISEDKRKIILAAAKKYNFSPNRLASRLSMKPVRIGVLINSKFDANSEKMIAGIKASHEELKDYKIQYDVTLLKAAEATEKDFRKALNRYKTYDGIILTGMSSSAYTPWINELCSVNPNVVQVQADNREAGSLFVSKHNEETASTLAAEFLYHVLKRSARKNVLLFTGDMESYLHANAQKSFAESCDSLGLSLLASVDMKDSEDYLHSILPAIFDRYKEQIDGIYITSGISSALCRYLEQHGLDIPLVAFDTYEDVKAYMQKGVISAAISQNVAKQMKIAFEMLVKHVITGETPPATVYTNVQLVLKSNMHQFD